MGNETEFQTADQRRQPPSVDVFCFFFISLAPRLSDPEALNKESFLEYLTSTGIYCKGFVRINILDTVSLY